MNITTKLKMISKVLEYEDEPDYAAITSNLREMIDGNAYIVDMEGKIAGFSRETRLGMPDDDVLDGEQLSQWVWESFIKKDNIQTVEHMKNGDRVRSYQIPIVRDKKRLGIIILSKFNGELAESDYLICDVIVALLSQYWSVETRFQKLLDKYDNIMVDFALSILSVPEYEGVMAALRDLENSEGVINQRQLAHQYSMTAANIKKGLIKLSEAGLIYIRPCFRSGTYIRVLNENLWNRVTATYAVEEEENTGN